MRRASITRHVSANPRGRITLKRMNLKFQGKRLTISVDLGEVKKTLPLRSFPPDSEVYVEIYLPAEPPHFELLGKISESRNLCFSKTIEVPDPIRARIRVVVIHPSKKNLIIASSSLLSPKLAESLLPTRAVPNLGRFWRLEFDCPSDVGSQPVLEYDPDLVPQRALKDPRWVHAVYPSVVREILLRCLLVPDEIADDWREEWLNFGKKCAQTGPPDTEEDIQKKLDWVEKAVEGFCRQLSQKIRLVKWEEESL